MNYGLNPAALVLLIVAAALLMLLPRRWAFLPLVATACYVTQGQGIELGPFSFSVLRILTLVGVVRVLCRREKLKSGLIRLDRILILWALWLLVTSGFHLNPKDDFVGKLGEVYDACGLYFIIRVFCQSVQDVARLTKGILFVLIPVGACMTYEVRTNRNPFSVFGGVSEVPAVREGRVRASGPFRHAILAGTVGAVSIPLAASLWRTNPWTAGLGCFAPLLMVYTSASSGPVLTLLAGIFALTMWPFRRNMKAFKWAVIALYFALEVVMKDPAYFVIARIDITGGSTGFHRAALIRSTFQHLSEWWFAGTDYTRHWMPTGVSWSVNHTDITNQYIVMGVKGGVFLMTIYIAFILVGFDLVGTAVRGRLNANRELSFTLWSLGSTLFAHAATFVSVAYFDQSRLFFYMLLATIGSAAVDARGRVSRTRGGDVTSGSNPLEDGYPSPLY